MRLHRIWSINTTLCNISWLLITFLYQFHWIFNFIFDTILKYNLSMKTFKIMIQLIEKHGKIFWYNIMWAFNTNMVNHNSSYSIKVLLLLIIILSSLPLSSIKIFLFDGYNDLTTLYALDNWDLQDLLTQYHYHQYIKDCFPKYTLSIV